jgi:hypothetical protein
VPAVALAWTGLLIVAGTLAAADIPSAAALGAANAAVGVLMHRGMLGLVRRSHHAQEPVPERNRFAGGRHAGHAAEAAISEIA